MRALNGKLWIQEVKRVEVAARNYATNRVFEIDLPLDTVTGLRLRDIRAKRIGGQIAETSCAKPGGRKGVQVNHVAAGQWNFHPTQRRTQRQDSNPNATSELLSQDNGT